MRWLVPVCLGAVLLAAAAPAEAAPVTIGPKALPERTGVASAGGATIFMTKVLPGVGLTSPIDGVIVRWRVRRGEGPGVLTADKVSLRVLKSTATSNKYTAAGTSSAHELPNSTEELDGKIWVFPTQLPIKAGETIGLGTTVGEFPYVKKIGASFLQRINPLADGKTATFAEGFITDTFIDLNADVEPDCDGDGLGDETQDPSVPQTAACGFVPPVPGAGTPPPAPISPDTLIAKGPKKKITTHGKRATVSFKFSSDDPAATFECRLDKVKYRHCSSPQLYLVKASAKYRKHTFSVRATSAAGTVDPTPATRTFKLKRVIP
jgi:hypothetical protein